MCVFVAFAAELVAQFKYTVLLMPNGPQRITGIPFDTTLCQSEHSVTDEELKKLITSSTKKKANKKKKATAAAAANGSASKVAHVYRGNTCA